MRASQWHDSRMIALSNQSYTWQAIDPAQNVAREYNLSIVTDLFGWTIVERHWGRIGTKGRRSATSFENRQDAERFVHSVRRKRASAVRRIGVAYKMLPSPDNKHKSQT